MTANLTLAVGGVEETVVVEAAPVQVQFNSSSSDITISKNSVDAENGHSLGGIISLNMKAGTNLRHGSAYL